MTKQNAIHALATACILLTVACTQDDVTNNVTPIPALPIAFDCTVCSDSAEQQNNTRAANGYTGIINNENKELFYTGFGVFASQTDAAPDLMYNQQVEYTFLADGSGKGYWTYAPRKYWPVDISHTFLCAYAPYVPTPNNLEPDATGITGLSDPASGDTPYLIYTRALKPEDNVDLLWAYFKPAAQSLAHLQLHHALARIKVAVTLDPDCSLPATTKVLLRRLTLTGNTVKTARLDLTGHSTNASGKLLPTWTNHTFEDRTIIIDNAPELHTSITSYGIIAENIRYIEDLPPQWQPAGLPRGTKTNVLCMGHHPSFLYLIPQSALSLSCTIYYTLIASDGTVTHASKATALDAPFSIVELQGNTTIDLNLSIKL